MTTASSHAQRFSHFLLRAAFDDRGLAAVEFGVVVPVLALTVLAVSDLGLGLARKMQVENAVQLGSSYAVVRGFDASAISAVVTNDSSISASPAPALYCGCPTGSGISAVACGSTCGSGARAGTYVSISAQATYSTNLNYQVVPTTYTLTAQSTVRLQ